MVVGVYLHSVGLACVPLAQGVREMPAVACCVGRVKPFICAMCSAAFKAQSHGRPYIFILDGCCVLCAAEELLETAPLAAGKPAYVFMCGGVPKRGGYSRVRQTLAAVLAAQLAHRLAGGTCSERVQPTGAQGTTWSSHDLVVWMSCSCRCSPEEWVQTRQAGCVLNGSNCV